MKMGRVGRVERSVDVVVIWTLDLFTVSTIFDRCFLNVPFDFSLAFSSSPLLSKDVHAHFLWVCVVCEHLAFGGASQRGERWSQRSVLSDVLFFFWKHVFLCPYYHPRHFIHSPLPEQARILSR